MFFLMDQKKNMEALEKQRKRPESPELQSPECAINKEFIKDGTMVVLSGLSTNGILPKN